MGRLDRAVTTLGVGRPATGARTPVDEDVWATLLRLLDVVAALEARQNETDARLRRRVRKTLAHYRRSGQLTDAPP